MSAWMLATMCALNILEFRPLPESLEHLKSPEATKVGYSGVDLLDAYDVASLKAKAFENAVTVIRHAKREGSFEALCEAWSTTNEKQLLVRMGTAELGRLIYYQVRGWGE